MTRFENLKESLNSEIREDTTETIRLIKEFKLSKILLTELKKLALNYLIMLQAELRRYLFDLKLVELYASIEDNDPESVLTVPDNVVNLKLTKYMEVE